MKERRGENPNWIFGGEGQCEIPIGFSGEQAKAFNGV